MIFNLFLSLTFCDLYPDQKAWLAEVYKNNHKESDIIYSMIKENNSLKDHIGFCSLKKEVWNSILETKRINGPDLNQASRKLKWKLEGSRDFPGGPVVKNPPSNAGDGDSIPGRGTKIPHATGQLSPRATTTEPACLN